MLWGVWMGVVAQRQHMAGHASNWFKTGSGGAKGKKVFISNAVIAQTAGAKMSAIDSVAMKSAKQLLNGSAKPIYVSEAEFSAYLTSLAKVSVQPEGQAQAAPTKKLSKSAQILKDAGLPYSEKKPKNTEDSGLVVEKDFSGWRVTHTNSKTIIARASTKAEAQVAFESLLATGVDFTKDTVEPNATLSNIAAFAKAGKLKSNIPLQEQTTTLLNYELAKLAKKPGQEKKVEAEAKAKAKAEALSKKPATKKEKAAAQALLAATQAKLIAAQSGNLVDQFVKVSAIWKRASQASLPSSDESSSMRGYQGLGYESLNGVMWKSTITPEGGLSLDFPSYLSDLDTMARNLMSASAKQPAPFAFTSYRAVNAYHPLTEWAKTVQVGDAYVNKGFDSSSLNPFMKPVVGSGSTATRLIFNVPKGAKGILFSGTPGYKDNLPHEMEWLAPANSTWMVREVRDVSGVREVVVELVAQRDFNGKNI